MDLISEKKIEMRLVTMCEIKPSISKTPFFGRRFFSKIVMVYRGVCLIAILQYYNIPFSIQGSEYIPVPVMEDDSVTVVAVNKEGHKAKDLLSWKSLRDINESLAPLFTVTNPRTGSQ